MFITTAVHRIHVHVADHMQGFITCRGSYVHYRIFGLGDDIHAHVHDHCSMEGDVTLTCCTKGTESVTIGSMIASASLFPEPAQAIPRAMADPHLTWGLKLSESRDTTWGHCSGVLGGGDIHKMGAWQVDLPE